MFLSRKKGVDTSIQLNILTYPTCVYACLTSVCLVILLYTTKVCDHIGDLYPLTTWVNKLTFITQQPSKHLDLSFGPEGFQS